MNNISERLIFAARRFCTLDIRALAAVRIGLGLIMIWQILDYLPQAQTFFSDQGVLPRVNDREILDSMGLQSAWTLYAINGSVEFARGMMLAQLITAIAFTVGFATRWANVICLILVWSLQMRNPLITTGGDVLLRTLLIWSMFLPMGAAASVDMIIRPSKRWPKSHVFNVATVGMVVQLMFVYFCAGVAKLNADWFAGNGLSMALNWKCMSRHLVNGSRVGRCC
ncbi:MAG: HTTM domain-containing protein [Pirellulaceae bacterium]